MFIQDYKINMHRFDVSIMYLLYAVFFKERIMIKVTDSHRTSTRTFIQP